MELYNFRQFKEAKVDFSQNKQKPFTIIEGKNGFGKSNLLNALTWCFYGVEEHLKNIGEEEAEPIINTREITKLKDGERISTKVIIKLATDKGDIKIEREIWGRKSAGKFYMDESSSFQILQQNERGNWDQSVYPTYVINRILPQIVTRFFFFDGEQLRRFFENINPEDVKNAIFDISQVSLIDHAITNLNKALSDYRAEDKSDDPRLNELNEDINFYKKNLEKIPNEIKESETQNKTAKKNIALIDAELRSSSIEVIKQLQAKRDLIQKTYDTDLENIQEVEKELAEYILVNAPMILAKDSIQNTLKILSNLSMEGILPPKIEDTFVKELLDIKKECICGTKLDKGEARQKLIKMLEDRKLKEGVSKEANELKYQLNPILKDIGEFDKKNKSLVTKIDSLKKRLKESNDGLNEVSAQLKKFGEFSKEDLLNKEKERDSFNEAISENIEKITALKIKIGEFKQKLKNAENDYDNLSKVLLKNKQLLMKKEFVKKGVAILEEIKNKMIDELRIEIEKNTRQFFTKMVSAKNFDAISIGEDYKIRIIKGGQPALKSLSVGETLLLGLSFMAALRKVSGFVAPLVIDTPLAPIDKEYRNNLIDFMSTVLEGTQIILLVKDTEYTENVKNKLKPKTGVIRLLKHDKSTGFTEVGDYA
jgi:DNA sulfur modification protein DndD